MTGKTYDICAFFFGLFLLILIGVFGPVSSHYEQPTLRFRPTPPKLEYSTLRTGPLEVAKVFGRSAGCADAESELIELTNEAAQRVGLDPKLAAAVVAVESNCNVFAVSTRGALGLMQIRPAVWKNQYDFEGVNLLNRRDNLKVGTEILAGLTEQYGISEGVRRYQGLGRDCESCDGAYTSKILNLAGRR